MKKAFLILGMALFVLVSLGLTVEGKNWAIIHFTTPSIKVGYKLT